MKMNSENSYVPPQCECISVTLDEGLCASVMSTQNGSIDGLNEDNTSESYIWN